MLELTIEQAIQKPETFLYVFADENKFLRYIDSKHAAVIRGKKANQNKVLLLSADKYGKSYEDYTTAIRQSFIDNYGKTPAQILVALAKGETVCGKNWNEGIYGIGKLPTTFSGTSISVDPTTGKILNNGVEVEIQKAVYGSNGAVCYTAIINDVKYTSNYRKISKSYYASQYVGSDGNAYNANGKAISSSETDNFWEMIIAAGEKLLNWLISLFGGNSNVELITTENTTPEQVTDGFATDTEGVSTAGLGTIGAIVLATAAIGGAIYGKKSKKNKK